MTKMTKYSTSHFFWQVLVIVAIAAASVSLSIGLRQSVWFDEAYSALLAKHSWGEIVRLTAQDVHPPVYYWLLKAWMTLCGSSELALRSLSALLFGCSVIVAGLFARRIFGVRVALLALPFVAFAPFLIRYGFEIRMYSLASLIGITATYILIAALDTKARPKRFLLFGVYTLLVTMGVYTLYYTALIWIAHAIWVAWLAYKAREVKIALPALSAFVVSFILFLPWLPVFFSKASGNTLSRVTHPLGLHNAVGIGSFSFLYRAWWQLGGIWTVLLTAAVIITAYLAYRGYKTASQKERDYLTLLILYVAVPVVILIIVTHLRPVYIERYMAHILIGCYTFIGCVAALAAARTGSVSRLLSAFVGVVFLLGCFQLMQVGNYNFQRLEKPPIKQIAGLLGGCRHGDVIFANDPQVAIELGFYITDCPIRFFNETAKTGGGYAMLSGSPLRVANPATELRNVQKLYYVYYDKPKHKMPVELRRTSLSKISAVSVATYEHK